MKIKLSNQDTVQLAKAIKGGYLDTDKVGFFKNLAENYSPPVIRLMTEKEIDYYKTGLYRGLCFIPNSEGEFLERCRTNVKELDPETYKVWEKRIESGRAYQDFIKSMFDGMVALYGLGGRFVSGAPDIDFLSSPEFLAMNDNV